jgi:uncharacterized protein (DUF488 family)
MPLFTFGYEGVSLEAFVTRLIRAGVRTVLDVRQLPLSRKQGFSKNSLAGALHRKGIVYTHIPALGCPRAIRDRYKADGNWEAYAKAYRAHLTKQGDALVEVTQIAKRTTACLICFEADFRRCHRSIVARATARAGGPNIVHLMIREEIPDVTPGLIA